MIEASVRLMLDVQHSGMPVTVRTKQGDTGRKLLITLTDGGNQYKLGADCQAVLAGKKPDGTVLFNNCEIDNNVIRYEFTEQTCAVAGNVISEIRIYGGGKLLTSASFVIEVLSTTVSEDDVISTDEMNALDALYLDTKALKDEIQQKLDNGEFIGPPGASTAEALDAANRARESANTATQAAAASAGAAASAEQAAVRAEAGAAKVEHIEKTAEEANAKVDTLREVVSKFHSNIQETVRGEVITVSDASDLPLAGLKVFGKTEQRTTTGKNLLKTDWAYFNSPTTEVTYTVNSDGSVTLNGTATQQNIAIKANVVSSEGVCILSSDVELPAGVYIYPSNSANGAISDITPGRKQCTISDASNLYSVRLIVLKGTTLSNFTIQLQLESGTVATDYEPYTGGQPSPSPEYPQELKSVGNSVNVTVCGKNLWPYGDVTVGGQNKLSLRIPGGRNFVISRKTANTLLTFRFFTSPDLTNTAESFLQTSASTLTRVVEKKPIYGCNYVCDGEEGAVDTNVQFEIGDVPTEYEPYKDGSTLTLSTPNGLPGIPVESGGNYTDSTGQQWICDEVDFNRGVYVQRVFKERLTTALETWTYAISCKISHIPYYPPTTQNNQKCSHLPIITNSEIINGSIAGIAMYSLNGAGYCAISKKAFSTVAECQEWLDANEVYVVYRLLNPILHNLSEIDPDALAAFATLHSNYPNTTVFNDKNAGMEVKYVADTKLYIDQKFNELAAALVSKV